MSLGFGGKMKTEGPPGGSTAVKDTVDRGQYLAEPPLDTHSLPWATPLGSGYLLGVADSPGHEHVGHAVVGMQLGTGERAHWWLLGPGCSY